MVDSTREIKDIVRGMVKFVNYAKEKNHFAVKCKLNKKLSKLKGKQRLRLV